MQLRRHFCFSDHDLDSTPDETRRLASNDQYEDTILPTGAFAGSPEDALDCACGLYLAIPDI